jgi:hypothetical protein
MEDPLVNIAGAAKLCGVKANTLRAYDSRREPAYCPFPLALPEHEIRRGNRIVRQWPTSIIVAWNNARKNRKAGLATPDVGQTWIDRAARIAGELPPSSLRRLVKIETVSPDGSMVGVVGWWQRRNQECWVDMPGQRHSSIRGDMWHKRMTFLA